MSTNGTPTKLALSLSEAAQAGSLMNRMISIAVHQVGTLRGPAGSKVRYGDDKVLSVMLPTSYKNLKSRDREILEEALVLDPNLFDTLATKADTKGIKAWSGRGKNAVEVAITAADFEASASYIYKYGTRGQEHHFNCIENGQDLELYDFGIASTHNFYIEYLPG